MNIKDLFHNGFLGKLIIQFALPAVEKQGVPACVDFLQKLNDEDEGKHSIIIKQAVSAVYPVIDVQVEDYAKKTATKVDDDLVKDFKTVLETFAKNNNFKLQNLDAGTPND